MKYKRSFSFIKKIVRWLNNASKIIAIYCGDYDLCRSKIYDKNSTNEGELKYIIVKFLHYLCSGLILLEGELW